MKNDITKLLTQLLLKNPSHLKLGLMLFFSDSKKRKKSLNKFFFPLKIVSEIERGDSFN